MAQLPPYDKEDMRRRMKGAVATLRHEFSGLRTGRASTSILEPVSVDAYGHTSPWKDRKGFEQLAQARPGDGLVAFHVQRVREGAADDFIKLDEK